MLLFAAASAFAIAAPEVCAAGAAAAGRQDYAAAEPLLARCVESPAAPLEAFLTLAGIYQVRRNADAVYRIVAKGIARFPAEKRFYLTAGTHEAREGRFEEAVKTLSEAARRWPGDSKIAALLAGAHFGLGKQHLDAGRNAEAVEHLRRTAPDDTEAQINLGRALHNLLRYTEAAEVFTRLAEANAPLAKFHRGLARYSLGEFDAAIADLTADIAYPPALHIRGLAYHSRGEFDKALADLDAAALKVPESAAVHYARARALVQLGRHAEAEPALRRAMALDPEDPAPINTLVAVLLKLGRHEEAKPLRGQAAELARRRRSAAPGEIRFESFRR